VPRPDAYFEPINWHRTALHELGHWTGAAQRLDRDLSGSFGSKKYAQEELVAEITSAFVCAMRMSDDPHDDYYIASILGSESSTFRLDQAILFATSDALERDALEKAISRTPQVDHWFASDFDGAIMFDEGDAVQHAAGEESECRAHDNLNAIPQAASVGDKAAA